MSDDLEKVEAAIAQEIDLAIKCAERFCGPVDFTKSEFMNTPSRALARYIFTNGRHLSVVIDQSDSHRSLEINPCSCWPQSERESFILLYNNRNEVH